MQNSTLKYKSALLFALLSTSALFLFGCASRENTPQRLDDATIIYPSKVSNGIYSTITLSNKISKKTGKPLKADTLFSLVEKAKLFATFDLVNYKSSQQKSLMFHVDWLDSTGNSFYKKRIDFTPSDSCSNFTSSISISPAKRKVGKYLVRLFLFRELIAEKYFHLDNSVKDSNSVNKKKIVKKKNVPEKKNLNKKKIKPEVTKESLNASIILCKKLSKKTGKPIGAGEKFIVKEKSQVKAIVNFDKPDIKTNEQMKFYFNWIGPDGKIFYKKRIVYTTSNPSFSLTNSISITPEKRKPGNYKIQILYKKKIIAEQKFELVLPTQ